MVIMSKLTRKASGLTIHLPTEMPPEKPMGLSFKRLLYMPKPPLREANILTPKSVPTWAWDAEQVTAISNTSMIFFIEQAVF